MWPYLPHADFKRQLTIFGTGGFERVGDRISKRVFETALYLVKLSALGPELVV